MRLQLLLSYAALQVRLHDRAAGVQQRYAETGQDGVDLRLMAADPGIERALPLLLAEAHAHRNLIIEFDGRIGHERRRAPFLSAGVMLNQEASDRAPHDADIDLARSQVLA